MSIARLFLAAGAGMALLGLSGVAAEAQTALAAVKKRGQLICGVNGQLPGFSLMDANSDWTGFDVDFCRAVAAAVLGDGRNVRFVPLTAVRRFEALKAGEVDVLVRNSAITLERTARTGLRDAAVTYIDGQAFVVPKRLNVDKLAGVDKRSVCFLKGTPHQVDAEEWFHFRRLALAPVMFDTQPAMYEAFFAGRCDAVSQDVSALASTVVASGKAVDYLMLPEIISKHPLGPFVRAGDDEWFDVVRWTHHAMLEAEERSVTRANVDEQLQSPEAAVRRLLGTIPGSGRLLGLDDRWAYQIVKQVGNYGEVFERNLGAGSALKFTRGINALWSNGGAMYPLPTR